MKTFAVFIAIGAALAAGFWLGRRDSGHEPENEAVAEEDVKPVAEVSTAPVRRAPIADVITAYGTIVAQSGDVRVLSMPLETRITRVLVTAGQQVTQGNDVITVEPSPDALLALEEARSTSAAAEKDLAQTEQGFKDQLATNAELLAARQAAEVAKLKLRNLTDRGAGNKQTLKKADAGGIVSKIDVQEGQIVAAGTPLVEIASGKAIEASIGVEPEDAPSLKAGQEVQLRAVGASSAAALTGKIRLVAHRVDLTSRLATVMVTLPPDAHWMLDTYVVAKMTKANADALVVPREALLPQEGKDFALFTVKNGHAVKHDVRIGLEDDRSAQLIGDEIHEGEAVVVEGSYELEDGMEVKVTGKPPATTESAP